MSEEKSELTLGETLIQDFLMRNQGVKELFDPDEDEDLWIPAHMSDKEAPVLDTYCEGFQLSVKKDIVLDYHCAPDLRGVDLNDEENGTSAMARCKSLAGEAFKGCAALRSVTLTREDLMLGPGCFEDCKNLESAKLGQLKELLLLRMFEGCSSLVSVILPDGLDHISTAAFEGCSSLREIRLPDSVTVMETAAFFGCESLEEVRLPKELVTLEKDVFSNCSSLRSLELPDSLRELDDCVFTNCVSLEEIRIPEGVQEIPFGTFCGCTKLRRVVLPASVTSVDPYAFYRCTALEVVEHPRVDSFGAALCHTPFWKKRHPGYVPRPQVPMELLNYVGGAVHGAALCIRGYAGFLGDRSYQIFATHYPDVWEVRELMTDEYGEAIPGRNHYLMDGNLKPIAGVKPLRAVPREDMTKKWQIWEDRKAEAAKLVYEQLLLGGET